MGQEKWQPFGLFSMTFNDLGMIPWLSRIPYAHCILACSKLSPVWFNV